MISLFAKSIVQALPKLKFCDIGQYGINIFEGKTIENMFLVLLINYAMLNLSGFFDWNVAYRASF